MSTAIGKWVRNAYLVGGIAVGGFEKLGHWYYPRVKIAGEWISGPATHRVTEAKGWVVARVSDAQERGDGSTAPSDNRARVTTEVVAATSLSQTETPQRSELRGVEE